MLDQARRRAQRRNLSQLTLIQEDTRAARLPVDTSAVMASASFEMVPVYDSVIRNLAVQLTHDRGRLGVGGLLTGPNLP